MSVNGDAGVFSCFRAFPRRGLRLVYAPCLPSTKWPQPHTDYDPVPSPPLPPALHHSGERVILQTSHLRSCGRVERSLQLDWTRKKLAMENASIEHDHWDRLYHHERRVDQFRSMCS